LSNRLSAFMLREIRQIYVSSPANNLLHCNFAVDQRRKE
jgi:hypothetical protein